MAGSNLSPTTSNPTKAAKPTRNIFDAWNSSSTGHQRAENRLSGSTSWRDSRTKKLGEQLKDGQRGGKRTYDTVGAGSKDFGTDGRLDNGSWEPGASGLRAGGQQSLWESFDTVKKAGASASGHGGKRRKLSNEEVKTKASKAPAQAEHSAEVDSPSQKHIFRNLVIFINGSTYPAISDHKLKRLLAEHGANISIALGRRTVTHVILGSPVLKGDGAGGGLASSKIQKEISTVKGAGVKFVSVEWVLESVKAGKRLPEARFASLMLANKGQHSVYGMVGGVTKK